MSLVQVVIDMAESDCYIATIDSRLRMKMGPRYDVSELVPDAEEGWELAAYGDNYAVWERDMAYVQKSQDETPSEGAEKTAA